MNKDKIEEMGKSEILSSSNQEPNKSFNGHPIKDVDKNIENLGFLSNLNSFVNK